MLSRRCSCSKASKAFLKRYRLSLDEELEYSTITNKTRELKTDYSHSIVAGGLPETS